MIIYLSIKERILNEQNKGSLLKCHLVVGKE